MLYRLKALLNELPKENILTLFHNAVTVKLFLYLIKYHAMKTHWGVEVCTVMHF